MGLNIGCPVVRTDGRCTVTITKFSGMGRFTYPWCSAGTLRVPELRYKYFFLVMIVDPRIVSPGKMHKLFHVVAIFLRKTTRATTLPVQSTVHATAIPCSTNDVRNADDGTVHSFACPCRSGFAVFGSAYIESRKCRKRSAKEKKLMD